MERFAYIFGMLLAAAAITVAFANDPWDAANRKATLDAGRLSALMEQPDRIGWRLSEDPALLRAVIWDGAGARRYPPKDELAPVPYEISAELERDIDKLRARMDAPTWTRFDTTGERLLYCQPEPATCLMYDRAALERATSLPQGRLNSDPQGGGLVWSLALASLAALVGAVALGRRRSAPAPAATFQLHPDRHCATRGTLEVALTPRDLKLLMLLQERQGTVVTKDELYDAGWGREFMPNSRALDQHIVTLRRKLDPDKSRPVLLETVRGVGYRLVN